MLKKYGIFIILACVNSTVLVFLLASNPDIHPDTGSYLSNSIFRAPLLPLLLDGFEFLFGANSLNILSKFQIIFSTAGIAIFSISLYRHFKASPLTAHISFTVLQGLLLKFGNSILSEPLSFGLHAFFMAALLAHIFTKKYQYLLLMIMIAAFELLIRPQFFYVFVFLIGYAGFMLLSERRPIYLAIITGILVIWIGLFFVRNTYNYAYSGVFGQYSAIGEHILATQLYISSPDDIRLFADPKDQEFLGKLYDRIDNDKLSIRHWDQSKSHYNKSIEHIYFSNILPVYAVTFPESTVSANIRRDAYCKRIGVTLMKANLLNYAKLLFLKIYYGPFNYLCLYAVLTGLAIMWFWGTRSAYALTYLSVSALTLLNYGMLIPFALIVKRYTLFSDAYQILFTALCGLLAIHHLQTVKKKTPPALMTRNEDSHG